MLLPKKTVWPFLARFGSVLAVYMVPWRPIGRAYGGAVASAGNWIIGGHESALHFGPLEGDVPSGSAIDAFNILLRAESTTGAVVRIPIDLRTLAYIPTVVFIALAVATPIWQGSRGTRVLVFGLAALQIFLALSIAAPLLLFFADPKPMHLVELSPGVYRVLDVLYRALVAPPGMAFAVPGLLWLLMLWIFLDARPERGVRAALDPSPASLDRLP